MSQNGQVSGNMENGDHDGRIMIVLKMLKMMETRTITMMKMKMKMKTMKIMMMKIMIW